MRVLVTGAAGFIGSHLCERLLSRGDTVVGLDNFDPFYDEAIKRKNLAAALEHPNFTFAQQDLRLVDSVQLWWTQQEPFDAIVHLAAKAGVRPSIEDPVGYQQANMVATANLLQLAVMTDAPQRPRFVFASSSSVYGNNEKVPFGEADNVDFPISPYAASKKSGELLCHSFHHIYDLPVMCLRFFTVYGPRQRPDLAIHKFTARILRGESIDMFGDGSSSRDYTYIDDIIDGVTAAVDRCDGYEIMNLGSKTPVTLSEMIATIESACKAKAKINRLPMQAGDVDRTFADVAKAGRLLDYQPSMPFAEGVRRFVQWYKQERLP